MHPFNLKNTMPTRSSILIIALLVATLAITGCNKQSTESGSATQKTASTAQLGDLSAFKKITLDTAALVDKGDIEGAKARIRTLETTWDEAEAGLKPRAAEDWHKVDKAIDRALKAVRNSPVVQTNAKQALVNVIATIDSVSH